MAWWDTISDLFSGAGDAIGNAASAVGDYGGQAMDAIGNYAGNALDSGVNLFAGDSPGNYSNLGGGAIGGTASGAAGLASSMPGDAMDNLMGVTNAYGTGAGLASSGGTSVLKSATDWARKNPAIVDTGLKLLGTSMQKTAPAAATTAGYNAAVKGNDARTAVGQSMISQAPFLANNALASAKGAGANASAAEAQRLLQHGYKPGDAVYDSAMQTGRIGNQLNEATAYGSGQAQSASQMNTGAGLMTPNLAGYDSLGKSQDAQQGAENKQNADYAGLAKNAFDIWANPDKANKDATSGTGAYGKP
jgi:hypothetical protein